MRRLGETRSSRGQRRDDQGATGSAGPHEWPSAASSPARSPGSSISKSISTRPSAPLGPQRDERVALRFPLPSVFRWTVFLLSSVQRDGPSEYARAARPARQEKADAPSLGAGRDDAPPDALALGPDLTRRPVEVRDEGVPLEERDGLCELALGVLLERGEADGCRRKQACQGDGRSSLSGASRGSDTVSTDARRTLRAGEHRGVCAQVDGEHAPSAPPSRRRSRRGRPCRSGCACRRAPRLRSR